MTFVLAGLASIPARARHLPRVLASLRPQVDFLCVYLNGYAELPTCVTELADRWILDPENRGAERKLHWADHDGICLSCDDDFIYPREYAATMVAAVAQWGGLAICSAHGRVYLGEPKTVHAAQPGSLGLFHGTVREGRWINHCGSGVMAWDARRVRLPREWPERNALDMQIAVWAQHNGVPIWLVPHRRQWFESLAPNDPQGIYRSSHREGHRRRNALLTRTTWKLLQLDT